MAAEIFIGRHGQNVDNANGILNGHRDLPLTDLGREQAHEAVRGMRSLGMTFDKIYASPLSRAYETAQIYSHGLGIEGEPEVLPELIERDFGVMTGVEQTRVRELCAPDILETETVTYMLSPEGAETFPDLVTRGHKIIDIVRKRHGSGNILLVCHGDIGKMVYAAATGKPWQRVLADFHFGKATVNLSKLPQKTTRD